MIVPGDSKTTYPPSSYDAPPLSPRKSSSGSASDFKPLPPGPGPSTQPQYPLQPQATLDLPPAYSAPPGPAVASSSTTAPGVRVNNLYITEQNHTIRGNYILDPTLRIPEALLAPLEDGEKDRDNLRLLSHNGSVSANIAIVGDLTQRVRINCHSKNGKVTVNVAARTRTPFQVVATADNGSVVILIPRDYSGPIEFTNGNGTTVFSREVHELFIPFNRVGSTGRGYIGSYNAAMYTGQENWMGDELKLRSDNGKIKIYFNDEPIPPSEWTIFVDEMTDFGPIQAIINSVKRGVAKTVREMRGEGPPNGAVVIKH